MSEDKKPAFCSTTSILSRFSRCFCIRVPPKFPKKKVHSAESRHVRSKTPAPLPKIPRLEEDKSNKRVSMIRLETSHNTLSSALIKGCT